MKRVYSKVPKIVPRIRRVNRVSISDAIVEQIMGLIDSGDLKPGQRLPSERELCVRFGAGRSSLREALRCLSILGVLNARVGDGTTVAANGNKFMGKMMQWRLITEQHDLQNLMEVRIALEGLAVASLAAHATDEDLETLKTLLEKMAAAVGDQKRFLALDLQFHLTIAKASGNPLVSDLISMIRGQLAQALSRVLMSENALPASLKEHARIVQQIRRGDAEGARKAMTAHLRTALVRYGQAVPGMGAKKERAGKS
jgi:GntR family transcriptional repressor for pyruvate dehydrogenase complex